MMHKSSMGLFASARNEFTAEGGASARFQRVLRHARTPWSLPAIFWKNINYVFVSRRPGYWNELGRGLAARGRHDEALACYDHALAMRSDIPQLWTNRGRALRNLDRLDEAEPSLREALRLKPDFVSAYTELALVLDYLGRFEEAETSVRTALRQQPEDALAHYRLGRILYHLGRATESEASFRMALLLRPKIPECRWALGQALLMGGQFEEGWKEFEERWQTEQMAPPFPMPSWTGETIGDRVILLFADQGHGDTLQFCRYVPRVAAVANKTILAVQPPLVRLMSRLPGGSEIIAQGVQPPSFDLWCALMSLPHTLGTTLQTIPATPYLTADPTEVAHWRERLASLAGLRVGLCWAGGQSRNPSKNAEDRRRSIPLATLGTLGEISGVQFISVQKGPPAAEAARSPQGMQFHDFTDDLHDFADTAALIESLDLVVTVDTAVAHLAGALGKPVWVLNRFDTCFRWPRDQDGSPWYSSARQFRQPTPGDWQSVIGRARDALQRLAAGDRSQLQARPTIEAERAR